MNHTKSSSAPDRYVALDVARFAAMAGIVWIHTPRSTTLGPTVDAFRFAVPFFVASAVFFTISSCRRHPDRGLRAYSWSRFCRIYLPFIAWSAVYLAFKGAKRVILPGQPNDFPGVELLWKGGAYHLWFLPFILVVTLGTALIWRIVGKHRMVQLLAIGIATIAGYIASSIEPLSFVSDSSDYLLLMWQAAPAACWGLAVALLFADQNRPPEATTPLVVLGVLLLIATSLYNVCVSRNLAMENAAGVALLLVAFTRVQGRHWQKLARWGRAAFGIYFVHLLLVKVSESTLSAIHYSPSWPLDAVTFIACLSGSLVIAWWLSLSHRTRWLVA